ncbi:ABC transporter substrate-binding protein [Paragemmobacter straminiformis]|uniref:ABC transporter substrate-binding protein n=1 Tax=Paragemmobacter straminiformis TaxID=2045119 RepID=A0A842I8T2_9RHOB|nr:ABC transporter substrate-binding protein [Gemmobacter straminiformis]MBC2835823.1 ABC transporter substrate-binding protein [Gemmobacter straminiformis]
MARALLVLSFCAVLSGPAAAEVAGFPARDGSRGEELVIYSTLDTPLAEPLIAAFQAGHPDIAVRYEDLLAGEIAARVIDETRAGKPTADFVFSSAMDMQLKLANDGYAQAVDVPEARGWPAWAAWQDTAFALTFEPAVLVYHKPSFPDGPPQSRLELMDWLRHVPQEMRGRIGSYDIERSAVGYLFLARDAEHFPDIWSLLSGMAEAGLQTFPTSQDIIDRVADGRLVLGYNILGSYAADRALHAPDLGLVLLKDFTVVVSRVALVPRAAGNAGAGRAFLGFLMGQEGQTLLSERLRLPAVSLRVSGANSAQAMQAALGDQLRPVAVSPGVLVYLDQAKRRRLIRLWHEALQGE